MIFITNFCKVKNCVFINEILLILSTNKLVMETLKQINTENMTENINDQILGIIWLTCCCFWSFFVFLFFLSNVFTALWVYFDAKKLNLEYPLIWAFLSLFSFPIGFVIYYFFVRRNII